MKNKLLNQEFKVPGAPIAYDGLNATRTPRVDIMLPEDEYLTQLVIQASVNLTGSGSGGTGKLSDIFRRVVIYTVLPSRQVTVCMVDAQTIDIAAINLAAIAKDEDTIRGSQDIVTDPTVAAPGVTYNGRWNMNLPLPGRRFIFTAELNPVSSIVTGGTLAATGATLQLRVTPRTIQEVPEQMTVLVERMNNPSARGYRSAKAAFINIVANELSTRLNEVRIGDRPTTVDELRELEAQYNDLVRGFSPNGTSTAVATPPITDPRTATDLFGILATYGGRTGRLSYRTSTTADVICTICSELPTDTIVEALQ